MKELTQLYELLITQEWVEKYELIRAKVPIIKITERTTGISIDIQNSSADGIETAKTVRKLCKQFPEIKPIILVLKSQLRLQNLNDTYRGGMTSFTLTCIVASYFQNYYRTPPDPQGAFLGYHLIKLYQLYGEFFDYDRAGISVRGEGFIFSREERDELYEGLFCVENPVNPKVNLGAIVRDMAVIRDEFKITYQML